jgi:hypothetical protein
MNINKSTAKISLEFSLVDIFDMVIDKVLTKNHLDQIALTLLNNPNDEAAKLLIDNSEFMNSLRDQLR